MRWDADAVRDNLRAYIVEHLGDAGEHCRRDQRALDGNRIKR